MRGGAPQFELNGGPWPTRDEGWVDPHARRTLCTLSVRPRAPTKQMGLFQPPARYLRIMASSRTRPKPGSVETSIIPSLIAGRLVHIDCQTGSRSGSAKHSA